jgi:TolB protein
VRNAGEITEQINAKVIPVRIESDQAGLRRLAQSAFSAHGAFRVEAGAGASYTLRFSVASTTSVRLTIESGTPARAIYNQTANGTSLTNALLRAADSAVSYLAKTPGFFAGRLTFISEASGRSEVYTSDLFFGEMLQLTHDGAQSITPRWSPDGRYILYTGYFRNGAPDIFKIDTVSNQRTSFVSVKGTNNGARFSPNGSQVAMILSGAGNPEVYLSDPEGRGITRLTRTDRQIEATPSWSPDGSRLVVASDALATGKPQLFLLSRSGGSLRRIPTNISGYCAEPDWNHANPDLVAFTAATGGTFQIAVYSFATGESRFVSRGPGDGVEPCWLSDGRHLLYTSRSSGVQRVFILDTETGRATPLSPTSLGRA